MRPDTSFCKVKGNAEADNPGANDDDIVLLGHAGLR
jgi:hypothetical protein